MVLGAGTLFAGGGRQQAADGEWRPTRPINIIVPWGAGGSTDQITRVTAAQLERGLGQRIVIINQPGASGATGTAAARAAARDGYTWTAGAAGDLALYQLMGLLPQNNIREDWELFLSVGMLGIVSVNVDSPWQTFDQLLADFRARPGEITVATAGVVSSGTINIEAIRSHTGIEYRLVTYDGGTPAVTAVVSGEAMVTTQLGSEQVSMIRGGALRPLAALSSEDLYISGFGIVPSIRNWVPQFNLGLNIFGIFIPKGVPQHVINTVSRVWDEYVVGNEEIIRFAADSASIFYPARGTRAQDVAFQYYQQVAYIFYDAGRTHNNINPATLGIPRP